MTVNRCACTRPSSRAAGGLGCRGDILQLQGASRSPFPSPRAAAEGARVEVTRFSSTIPRLRPPKTLTDPEAHARRPGSLTIGTTTKVVLAVATLEGGLALKILYKARRRRAPRSHLVGPAAAAPPSPTQLPLQPLSPPSPPPPHNAAREASEDRAKPLERSPAGRTWHPT